MADNETDANIPADHVQPTVSTNSVADPAVTVIDPATQKVTEIEGEVATKASQPILVADAALEEEKPSLADGEPNGLPPAAPMVQLQPPAAVKALREWEHMYLKNDKLHAGDDEHMHVLHQHLEAICARIHSKYPARK